MASTGLQVTHPLPMCTHLSSSLCCIAPVLAAKVLRGVEVTVGHEQEEGGKWPYAGTAEAIKALGAKHCVKGVTISFPVVGGPQTAPCPFMAPFQVPHPWELLQRLPWWEAEADGSEQLQSCACLPVPKWPWCSLGAVPYSKGVCYLRPSRTAAAHRGPHLLLRALRFGGGSPW